MTYTLAPGDALFVPPYWWHRAAADQEESVGLSFGVVDPTFGTLVERTRNDSPTPASESVEPSFWLWRDRHRVRERLTAGLTAVAGADDLTATEPLHHPGVADHEASRRELVHSMYELADRASLHLAMDDHTRQPTLMCQQPAGPLRVRLAPGLVPFAR